MLLVACIQGKTRLFNQTLPQLLHRREEKEDIVRIKVSRKE